MASENISETFIAPNTGETQLGTQAIGETMLSAQAETVLDASAKAQDDGTQLSSGQTVAGGYVVIDQIGKSGAQSSVYTVRRGGKQCVIKMYNRGYKPSEDFISALKEHTCPYVAHLVDYGYSGDTYYEIYDYYTNGTLEDKGKCTLSFIKETIIPDINEGLHFLHTFNSKGIVHGDIKPGNIFISNDGDHVVIGDFGISSYMDSKGRLIEEIKGTPEYAPRTVAFFGSATKTPAYDYGSFGLVLIKLATGHSIFEGLSTEAISKKWADGIELPDSMDSRLKRLIEGLLVEDEKKRFGYEEVKKWCEGEFVQVKNTSIYSKEDFEDSDEEADPFVFGVFGEKVVAVSSLKELASAIAENWEHAKKQLKRVPFYNFIAQFKKHDSTIEKDIREYSAFPDEDKAVFFTLYRLGKNPNVIYKGINYGTAKEFIKSLNTNLTPDMEKIVNSGLFEHFLKVNGYDEDFVAQVSRIMDMRHSGADVAPKMLYYLLNSDKEFTLNGKRITDINELIDEVASMQLEDIEKAASDSGMAAWLYSIGYKDEAVKLLDM